MSRRRRLFRSAKARRKRGFTLIELLVVMALLTLISGILIALVTQSSALVSKGAQTIALNQKSRFALDKLSPYLVTAVSDMGSPALALPKMKDSAVSAEELVNYEKIQFTTTEDFLDPDYRQKYIETATWSSGTNTSFYYEIYFDRETNPIPYMREDGTTIQLGRILLRKYTDSGFSTVDTSVAPRPLAFNVQYFYCHLLTDNSLEVWVHTIGKRRGPAGNQIDVFEQAQGVVTIPSPSYN